MWYELNKRFNVIIFFRFGEEVTFARMYFRKQKGEDVEKRTLDRALEKCQGVRVLLSEQDIKYSQAFSILKDPDDDRILVADFRDGEREGLQDGNLC